MDNKMQELVREIKCRFRLAMNGFASRMMREQGLDYKMNFGVELPRLKEIALQYGKSHELAQELWKENIREAKIVAGMLQPVETFYPEIADIWIESMQYPDIAEITCMTLFQHLPYAPAKAFEWMADERELFQLCGFLLTARLLAKGLELNERAVAELLDQVQAAILSDGFQLRKAAMLALTKFALQKKENVRMADELLSDMCSGHEELLPLYEALKAEVEELP